jgi:hypothetical protein
MDDEKPGAARSSTSDAAEAGAGGSMTTIIGVVVGIVVAVIAALILAGAVVAIVLCVSWCCGCCCFKKDDSSSPPAPTPAPTPSPQEAKKAAEAADLFFVDSGVASLTVGKEPIQDMFKWWTDVSSAYEKNLYALNKGTDTKAYRDAQASVASNSQGDQLAWIKVGEGQAKWDAFWNPDTRTTTDKGPELMKAFYAKTKDQQTLEELDKIAQKSVDALNTAEKNKLNEVITSCKKHSSLKHDLDHVFWTAVVEMLKQSKKWGEETNVKPKVAALETKLSTWTFD